MKLPLEIGQKYTKIDLAEILKDPTIAPVREGVKTLKDSGVVLFFVDLEKAKKEERFRFNDLFDGSVFHWDSQTTQHINTPRIQSIISGELEPHLMIRIHQKVRNKTMPFVYAGRLKYLRYNPKTSKPVHIEFESLDYQDSPSSSDLLKIYNWKPEQDPSQYELFNIPSKEKPKPDTRKRTYTKPDKTERSGLVTSRVGQGYYRDLLMTKWNRTCPVTGSKREKILIASHIKPWSESDEDERVDQENGILLSPNADALFDRHLISFDNDGNLLKSSKISTIELSQLGISENVTIPITEGMIKYLHFHRQKMEAND